MPKGWTPEGTATYQRGVASLLEFIHEQERRDCLVCQGGGSVYVLSEEMNSYMPVRCHECFGRGRRDGAKP